MTNSNRRPAVRTRPGGNQRGACDAASAATGNRSTPDQTFPRLPTRARPRRRRNSERLVDGYARGDATVKSNGWTLARRQWSGRRWYELRGLALATRAGAAARVAQRGRVPFEFFEEPRRPAVKGRV